MKKYFNRVLTIDPGDNTALAYWNGDLYPDTKIISLKPTVRRTFTREEQLVLMWDKFEHKLRRYPTINTAYIEGVQVWAGSLKSLTAARKGTLMKLTYLIGGYCKVMDNLDIEFHIINPQEWKGQLSKQAVANRIKRITGNTYNTEHETDAVGIGLSMMKQKKIIRRF